MPYGIYDITANTGWVNVGTDHDTAAFAVESIRRWWHDAGTHDYPNATRLLITADAGGSNGYRSRTWKTELAALAAEIGLAITVCPLPPGTSKWNKIEHRLFCHITLCGQGQYGGLVIAAGGLLEFCSYRLEFLVCSLLGEVSHRTHLSA